MRAYVRSYLTPAPPWQESPGWALSLNNLRELTQGRTHSITRWFREGTYYWTVADVFDDYGQLLYSVFGLGVSLEG